MLNRLYVYIQRNGEWIPCGLLNFTDDGRYSRSVFRYGRKYLERQDAISIDPLCLPLEDHSFQTPEGFAVFGGIRDAAPDKWGRYLLEKKFSRELSDIEYVAASSDDRVGALAFSDSPEGGPKYYSIQEGLVGWFPLELQIQRLDLKESFGAVKDAVASEDTDRLKKYLEYGPSLGGARPKATILWKKKLYLAKFSLSLDSKNEPLIEYATMSLAKKCGLNVPPMLVQQVAGRTVFLIERFDRQGMSRIPFISGLTVTGQHESDYGRWSYFSLIDAIVRFSKNPENDLQELFKRLVFNIAVNNNDDHPRNFGFLGAGGFWNLSPLYDVVPGIVHTQTYALSMSFGGEGRKASYRNALSGCEHFRLTSTRARAIIQEVDSIVSEWRMHFGRMGVMPQEIKMLENSFLRKQ